MDETALIEAIGADEDSGVLLGYVESIQNGGEFMRVARSVSKSKPVIIFKSGGTVAGAKAASSHTGALAGSDHAYAAAFRQSGVLRAREVMDLFDWGLAFSYQKHIRGPNVALVTNAGGPGIIATDALERSSLKMASLAKSTVETLHEALPPTANVYNPIDILGDARADRYGIALHAALTDPGVDGVIVILTPQTSTEPLRTAEALAEAASKTDKPVLACFMGGTRTEPGFKFLMEHRVPAYSFPERAVSAMDALHRQRLWIESPESDVPHFEVDKGKVESLFQQAKESGRLQFGEQEAREVITAYGFRVPKSRFVNGPEEAAQAAREIGFPVVMKISSPDILHKSDVGGVRIGLESEQQVDDACLAMTERVRRRMPNADIRGVLVQEMIRNGKEVILGMTRDPQFGPMLMFGLGGIYVEVLKDVSFRIAPITRADAESMMREIRSHALLRGVRGESPTDLAAVAEGLLRLSQLVTDFPEIVEIDVNPLAIFPRGQGATAIDVRLTLAAPEEGQRQAAAVSPKGGT